MKKRWNPQIIKQEVPGTNGDANFSISDLETYKLGLLVSYFDKVNLYSSNKIQFSVGCAVLGSCAGGHTIQS